VQTYTPAKTAAAEKVIRLAYLGPKYASDVKLRVDALFDEMGTTVTITPILIDAPTKLRGDIDNYVKLLLDGLNGVAWDDDSQVVKVIAVKM